MRKSNGEGTVQYNDQRKRWEGKLTLTDVYGNTLKNEKGNAIRKKFIGKTQKEVLKKMYEHKQNTKNGVVPNAGKLTLKDWIKTWLQDFVKPAVRTKSHEKYQSCINNYIVPKLGNAPLQKLNTTDIQNLLNELVTSGGQTGQGLAPITVRNTRRYLSMALDKAVALGIIQTNPVKLTNPPKMRTSREITPLTAEQANRLLLTAKTDAEEKIQNKLKTEKMVITAAAFYDLYMAIAIALGTGMRLGEVMGLKWTDIKHEQKIIALSRSRVATAHGTIIEEPKNGRGRRILLDDNLFAEIILHKERQNSDKQQMGDKYLDEDWVIGGQYGKNYESTYFQNRKYKPILEKAGIPKSVTFHDLRHTHATMLLLQSVHPKIVQERLGHSTINLTLDAYSHIIPDNQRAAVKAISILQYNKPETDPERDKKGDN